MQQFTKQLCLEIVLLAFLCFVSFPVPVKSETSAPGIHWGALGYPDQDSTLLTGVSIFRFTEFNGNGERFNGINETIGLNLVTFSWTEHLIKFLPDWSTNFTLGIGPTRDQPSEWLQNDFIHDRVWKIPQVPVEGKRHQTDFTVSGSITHWWQASGQKRVFFMSAGGQTGSLYHEVFARGGIRRWSPLQTLERVRGPINSQFVDLLRPLRVSGMVRAGRIANGAAFNDLTENAFMAQGSVSYGWYDAHSFRPLMEVEVGVTINSGIFKSNEGDSLQERFWTIAFRLHPFTFETWNDQLNSKDFGPTYGARLMADVYFLLPESWKN